VTRLRAAECRATRPAGALLAVIAGASSLTLAGCAAGAIAQSTPASSGQSFVQGTYSSAYFSPGSRPKAPAVAGRTIGGGRFSLAADRGNVVVLNFWGSWCAPCRSEAPALAALAAHFESAPVRFVGDDVHDSPTTALAFERTYSIGYPSLNDPGEQVALAFHGTVPPVAIPTTLLIDRSGHIAGRVVGEISYRGLLALIDKVLARPR
jgi:thiol-disulfide isomerase/thioredoxin